MESTGVARQDNILLVHTMAVWNVETANAYKTSSKSPIKNP
jgi:hypothetical protein